ncbi:MAG: hypothetical protein ABI574_00890 [Burkholderiales bacterium]
MSDEQTQYAQAAADQLAGKPPQLNTQVLGARLLGEFAQAEIDRQPTEQRWLKDIRQYRGQYDPEVLDAIGPLRSKAFVRKTRVKVKTVDSRVVDLLFPAGAVKNWEVAPTPKPSLSPEHKAEIAAQLEKATGKKPDRNAFDAAVIAMAKESAKAMSATINDQLVEARYKDVSIKAIHSGHLYGTGIVKGPLVERRVRTRFVKQGKKWVTKSESYVVPFLDYVPIWRFYPDMTATELSQCRYVYERHSMTRAEMAELARRKSFNGAVLKAYILAHPDGEVRLRHYDNELRSIGERETTQSAKGGAYEVLERWGWLSGEQLREVGVKVPDDQLHDSFFSNVWLLPNGEVIKAVLQPIDGVTWPYHLYYFDKDETSIFGEGLSAIMRDDQTMINAAIRMMLDNAAITSGAQLEVTLDLLSNSEKVNEVVPWKVWPRNSKSPGQRAINVVELPSRSAELSAMAAMFENNADEVTAIPRYMSGENATTGAAGTSSGLSMLMGAVNIVIKDLITAWDEGVTVSFIRALYHWNMKFNQDDSIKGDYDVQATGTASLVAKEVRARALNEFAAGTANPMDAPYVKRDKLLRQRAEANELSDVVKTEDEVAAEMESDQAKQNMAMQQQIQQLQMQEAQAKVAKLSADAELARGKLQEMLANIEKIVAETVGVKVAAAYAALQAGGVATSSPHVAPAGDEILRSAGWKDATPNPTISQLNGPPVQQDLGTTQVLNKGQSFVQEPRAPAGGAPGPMEPPPQTGMAGSHAGIETAAIE